MGLLGALIPKSVQLRFINEIAGYINKNHQEELKVFEGKTVLFDVTGLNRFYLCVNKNTMSVCDGTDVNATVRGSFMTLKSVYGGSRSVDDAMSSGDLALVGEQKLIDNLKKIFEKFVVNA